MSPAVRAPLEAGKGIRFFPRASRRAIPANNTLTSAQEEVELLTSGTVRESICVVLSHQIGSTS